MRYFAVLSIILFLASITATAQVEGNWLSTKGNSRLGWAAAWDFGIRIDKGDYITFEPNYQAWGASRNYVEIFPILAGYRYTFNRKGKHFFVEPLAGYTWGHTNITATNSDGQALTNSAGDTLKQKAAGFTGGLGIGYIFSTTLPFNLELRWEHIFVADNPKINILGLHIAYMFLLPTKYR